MYYDNDSSMDATICKSTHGTTRLGSYYADIFGMTFVLLFVYMKLAGGS